MYITRKDADDFFTDIGYIMATTWSDTKMLAKLNEVDKLPFAAKVDRRHHQWPLKKMLMASLGQDISIKLGEATIEEEKVVERVDIENEIRTALGKAGPGKVSLGQSLTRREHRSRAWWIGYMIAQHADANGNPTLPNDIDMLIEESDNEYVESCGLESKAKPNPVHMKWYFFLAKSVLAGYFQHLQEREFLKKFDKR